MTRTLTLLLALAGVFSIAHAQDAQRGSTKVQMCIGCHGIVGYQADFPQVYKVPKIAGQDPKYIAAALTAYRGGDRKHPTMRSVAASLSDQDIADIAAYYSKLGQPDGPVPAALETPVPDKLRMACGRHLRGLPRRQLLAPPPTARSRASRASTPTTCSAALEVVQGRRQSALRPRQRGDGRDGQAAEGRHHLRDRRPTWRSLPGELRTVPQAKFKFNVARGRATGRRRTRVTTTTAAGGLVFFRILIAATLQSTCEPCRKQDSAGSSAGILPRLVRTSHAQEDPRRPSPPGHASSCPGRARGWIIHSGRRVSSSAMPSSSGSCTDSVIKPKSGSIPEQGPGRGRRSRRAGVAHCARPRASCRRRRPGRATRTGFGRCAGLGCRLPARRALRGGRRRRRCRRAVPELRRGDAHRHGGLPTRARRRCRRCSARPAWAARSTPSPSMPLVQGNLRFRHPQPRRDRQPGAPEDAGRLLLHALGGRVRADGGAGPRAGLRRGSIAAPRAPPACCTTWARR